MYEKVVASTGWASARMEMAHMSRWGLSRSESRRVRLTVAMVSLLTIGGGGAVFLGSSPATADVTAVTGSAYGDSVNVTFFGGQQPPYGPVPTVTLAPTGTAQTDTTPNLTYQIGGIAYLMRSGPATVTTQGTTGVGGSVTSTADIQPCPAATAANACPLPGTPDDPVGQVVARPVTTGSSTAPGGISSTCTADDSGATGSTTLADGLLRSRADASGNPTMTDPVPTGAPTTLTIPVNPPPNYTVIGINPDVPGTDTYTVVFNEQVVTGNVISLNAVHLTYRAPPNQLVAGEQIIGHVECGATVSGGATTTTTPGATTTTTPGATTTTTRPSATTTTRPATTTTTVPTTTAATAPPGSGAVSQVGGSAFGFYVTLGLFGGPPVVNGPAPTVSLPASGSDPPVTASLPSGEAVYGPAHIFVSGPLTVSTQGTPQTAKVTSSARVESLKNGGGFTADLVTSTCTADASGSTGSASVTKGVVATSTDPSGSTATTAPVPAEPSPNFSISGTVDNVKGSFKVVFNEQITNPDGSITVNAAHVFFGTDPNMAGPAKGDLIIGQSICALSASGGPNAAVTGAGSPNLGNTTGGGAAGAAAAAKLAGTGIDLEPVIRFALMMLMLGCAATSWTSAGRREDGAAPE